MVSTPWFLKKTARLERIIRRHRRLFTPHDNYGVSTSPRFWRNVFLEYYRDAPVHDQDARWDELFKKGFPLLRALTKPKLHNP